MSTTQERLMRAALAIALVGVAAVAFFNTIIGVFGLRPALVGLVLFLTLACALAARSQYLEDRP